VGIYHANRLMHIIVMDDNDCFMYTLELVEDLDTKQVFIKANGEMINSLYEEDLSKLTLSDFAYNQCLYYLYKQFLKIMEAFG